MAKKNIHMVPCGGKKDFSVLKEGIRRYGQGEVDMKIRIVPKTVQVLEISFEEKE